MNPRNENEVHENEITFYMDKESDDYINYMVRNHFGNVIRNFRDELKLSRKAFSDDFNNIIKPGKPLTSDKVRMWESGRAFPHPDALIYLYIYFAVHKNLPCDFNEFFMYDGLEGASDIDLPAVRELKMSLFQSQCNFRLQKIPVPLLKYFDKKIVMLEISGTLFAATVDAAQEKLRVTDNSKSYEVSFTKAQRLKVYHMLNNTDEAMQISSILPLREAKHLPVVYIHWIDQSDMEYAQNISGYYSYSPALRSFTNSQMDIHLHELDYLKTYYATKDIK